MIKKITIAITAVAIIAAIINGILDRGQYTDYFSEDEPLYNYSISECDYDYLKTQLEFIDEKTEEAPVILKVRATGRTDYLFETYRREVVVEKVIKGSGIEENQTIYIHSPSWFIFNTGDINLGFVNELVKDDEYLVFIDQQEELVQKEKIKTYALVETNIACVFNCKDKDNVVVSNDDENSMGKASYDKVSGNEVFMSSKEALDSYMELKHDLLEKYN